MVKVSRSLIFGLLSLLVMRTLYLRGHLDFRLTLTKSTHATLFRNSLKPPLSQHIHTYFNQVFAVDTPPPYDFPAIQAACRRVEWKRENENVYLQCESMAAGMTSILSQVKVCFKMAIDAGVHIILPSMPLRDSDDLTNFNSLNQSAYMTYEQWFDAEHLALSMGRACPQMRIRHPDDLKTAAMPVSHEWSVDVGSAPGFVWLGGYFWVGRPFKIWFDDQLSRLRSLHQAAANEMMKGSVQAATEEQGATIVRIASQFLIYRITDDATGRDLAIWNDISYLVRLKEAPRAVTARILSLIQGPFIGLHFRVERDNIWSSFETQLERDLDILDKLWALSGTPDVERPVVYLACGDETQIFRFSEAAKPRGWTVTSKYALVKDEPAILTQLKQLPFDFQGAIDMGIMLKSDFFVGITGSAFSSTVANIRDATGRYRGSSIYFPDDENARTHLFNDGDCNAYACCL